MHATLLPYKGSIVASSFFATATFDFERADSSDYQAAEKNLAAVGLYKALKADDGSSVELPYNTFAGTFTGDSPAAVRDYVRSQAKSALSKSRLSGRLFVAVGSGWGWGAATL